MTQFYNDGTPPVLAGTSLTCGLVQARPELLDKEANLEKALRLLEAAATAGVDLLLFPELFLTGYYVRDQAQEVAEAYNGPSLRRLAGVARDHDMVVLMGFPELDQNHVFNSVAVINADGNILGAYRKVHLYNVEPRYFAPGDAFSVFDTAIGRLGVQICFDLEFPETARALALEGAQIIATCSANMVPFQDYQHVYLRARAMENHVLHALVNRVGTEEDTHFFGGSGIATPLGDVLLEGGADEELLVATVDHAQIADSISSLDYLNNRRPAAYSGLSEERSTTLSST